MKKLISVLLFLAFTLSILSLVSCEKAEEDITPLSRQYYDLFNTVSVIYSYNGEDSEEFDANCKLIYSILLEYHRLFDIYYEYANVTNLATVNKMAGKGPVKIDEKLIDFLLYTKDMYALTDGQTNVALGSVLSLWHDARSSADPIPPSNEVLKEASLHTSIDSIVIDREASTVEITDPNLRIDAGAIGKGYAVERARLALVDAGVTGYALNIGGNLAVIGTKTTDSGWRTAIKNPCDTTSYSLYVELKNTSCVTSGSYERYFIYNGEKYHHVIDPDTLMPSEHFGSVTVITEDSGLADALSTALFCMSYEDGLALVSSLPGVETVWISNTGEVKYTDGVIILSE